VKSCEPKGLSPPQAIAGPLTSSFPVHEVTEGRARLLVPEVPRKRGPGSRGPWPFYNPTMVVSRDLSAVALARWPFPLREVLDGLAATGVWGIRVRLETAAPVVAFNDWSRDATQLIERNLGLNGLEGEILSMDLRTLLASRAFDFVDIDPFGPPTPFLDAAIRGARSPLGVGITATDTAPLSGTYPAACLRRYGARPLRCPQGHEIGLRILLGYTARLAMAYGKRMRPMLSFAAEHFLRALVLLVSGFVEGEPLGRIVREPDGRFSVAPRDDANSSGPLWLGPLCDATFVRSLAPSEWTQPASARLLARLQEEADMPPWFVTTNELGGRLLGSPPRIDRFLDALRAGGYRATRTHFDPRGVKTDAPMGDVVRVFRRLMPP